MTAMNVRNNHVGPLGVGGVTINPGATARIENWESVGSSSAVRQWIDAEILTINPGEVRPPLPLPNAGPVAPGGLPGLPPAPPALDNGGLPGLPSAKGAFGKNLADDPEGEEKDALIARLKELTGAEKTRASGLESLKKQVAEAEAKAKS